MNAPLVMMRTPAESAIMERFRDAAPVGLPAKVRGPALERLAAGGLPTRRDEAWHYTDLRAWLRELAPLAEATSPAIAGQVGRLADPFGALDAARLTLIDGMPFGAQAVPAGVEVLPLSRALTQTAFSEVAGRLANGGAISDLNAAMIQDGLALRVRAGAQVVQPVHLLLADCGPGARLVTPRIVIVVEEGASLTLLESHLVAGEGLTQHVGVIEIAVGHGAHVEHVRFDRAGAEDMVLSLLAVELGRQSRFDTLTLSHGAGLARREVHVRYAGEGALAGLRGVALLSGSAGLDTTLLVDHAVPHGESRELFKHIIEDAATGTFQGKIVVRKDAQKTDGRMMSQALLLGEDAAMNNKPELEIFADDVQCAHGATCGALDDNLLFYLRARGLPKPVAEGLLIQAFAGEALEAIAHVPAREALVGIVEAWLLARADKRGSRRVA